MLRLHFENGTIERELNWHEERGHLEDHDGVNVRVFTEEKGFMEAAEEQFVELPNISSAYQWDKFYEAVTERKVFENETQPEDIANVVKVVEMMAESSLKNPV